MNNKRIDKAQNVIGAIFVALLLLLGALTLLSSIITDTPEYTPCEQQYTTVTASVPPPTVQPIRTRRMWITTVPANVPPLTVAELDNVEYVGIEENANYLESEAIKPEPRYTLTAEEKHLLKFVADREDSHSVESRLAVMQVVMNRVNDSRFPDTVRDVLFQRNQFHVMPRYSTCYVSHAQAYEALERLLYDECIFDGANAIFFAAARVCNTRIARRLYLIAEIGGSRFWGQVKQ